MFQRFRMHWMSLAHQDCITAMIRGYHGCQTYFLYSIFLFLDRSQEEYTRILKRMLPYFPGCDITILVVKHGESGKYRADDSGFDLFAKILLQLTQYVDLALDSPLQALLRDVEAQGGDRAKKSKHNLNAAQRRAKIILELLAKPGCVMMDSLGN